MKQTSVGITVGVAPQKLMSYNLREGVIECQMEKVEV